MNSDSASESQDPRTDDVPQADLYEQHNPQRQSAMPMMVVLFYIAGIRRNAKHGKTDVRIHVGQRQPLKAAGKGDIRMKRYMEHRKNQNRAGKIMAALMGSMLFGVSCTGSISLAQEKTMEADFAGVFQVDTEIISVGDYVTYEYPVLTGVDGFDQSIIDAINSHFFTEAEESAQAQAEDFEYTKEELMEYNPEVADSLSYEVTCESVLMDKETFSVMQFCYVYSGGAHGYSWPFGTSFNLRTGEEMTMGELLGCDEAVAREAVVEAYRREIIGQVENITEDTIRESFDEMEFWLEEDGLHVNLAPYIVASYAAGQQHAVVTPEILENVISGAVSGQNGAQNALPGNDTQGNTGNMATVSVINGIEASASDFIFPYSSSVLLTDEDLKKLEGVSVEEEHYKSQLAINEILARYGYVFNPDQGGSAKEAYDQFEGLLWYEEAKAYCPSASANEMLYTYINSTELENIEIICEWQKAHNCYY